MSNIDLNKVHLDWCVDILKRIQQVIDAPDTEQNKLVAITWLVKQALKVEREED